ncbi:carbon-nitrogen hydrolase family protein [Phaeovulum sp.]|uniref:carbon-nitrogen hydrolase family protein n=1 Tax=Phaeovulum sp. TaxID=2934796 RepID=UPI0027305722|nr:carbon-nitrogen hydrolase family protein [Phaeovulum sp.]MDP1669263.1 carbon-nitrogen hydrolase family protein [Phaeovulum sp.]MDZ4119272.1 carbon-nitrogen hydrolase family protein [Phaeovulum sp.]
MRAALIQLSVTDDWAVNLPVTLGFVRQAVAAGAGFVLTPEATNLLSSDRAHQRAVLHPEASDPTLAALRAEAARAGVWLLIGSLALKTDDADGRFANRSFLIGPDGSIAARYDKIHMFDVEVSETERYRESEGYRPGARAVLAATPFARLGLSVCYDLRFPYLYRALAHAGAEVLTVPAAFNDTTGAAHWEPLLRARAIENGAYVLAPAQCGSHAAHAGRPRRTHGHSLAVAPWGEVLADGGTEPGVSLVTLDLAEVARARARVPSLSHDRPYAGPTP